MSEGIGRKFQVGARNLILLGILEDKLKCPRVPHVKVHFVCLDLSPFSAKSTPLNLLLSVEERDWEDGRSLQWPTRSNFIQLGSVVGPVMQASGRLTFEDDLRSEGLLCFISMNPSVRTELADSMVTPGEPGGD